MVPLFKIIGKTNIHWRLPIGSRAAAAVYTSDLIRRLYQAGRPEDTMA
jgi:hypothetical protein